MNNSEKSKKIGSILFLCVYIPSLFVNSLSTTLYNQKIPSMYFTGITMVALIAIVLKIIIFDQHTFFEYIFYACIVLTIGLAYHHSDDKALLIMTLFMLASINLDNKKIIKWYLVTSLAVLILAYISTRLGTIQDLTYTRNLVMRHSFGIVYPTDFAAHIFYICCGYVFLRFEKFGFLDFFGLIIVAGVTFRFTEARLNAGMICMLAVTALLVRNEKINNLFRNIMWIAPGVSMIFTYGATKLYNPMSSVFATLNKLFSNRLGLVQSILNQNGIKLFGQKIIENGYGGKGFYMNRNIYQYTYIDSVFMRLLIIYGLIATIFFVLVITICLFKLKNTQLILIVGLIILSGIIEQHFIEIAYNPFFLLLVSEYFKERRQIKCKNT